MDVPRTAVAVPRIRTRTVESARDLVEVAHRKAVEGRQGPGAPSRLPRPVPPTIGQEPAPLDGAAMETSTPVFGSPSKVTSGVLRSPVDPAPRQDEGAALCRL